MRTLNLTLAALLACGMIALGQVPRKKDTKPAPKKSELEKTLAEVLKSHPDIRAAEAKLALAQAELDKARFDVAQTVVKAATTLRHSKASLEEALAQLRLAQRAGRGVLSERELRLLELTVARCKGDVEAAELAMKHLRASASGAAFSRDGEKWFTLYGKNVRVWDANTGKGLPYPYRLVDITSKVIVGTPMADRIRKALEKKITMKDSMDARQLLETLRDTSGLHITAKITPAFENSVNIHLGEVPLGAVFQFAEDQVEGHRFVIREYGLIFVPQDKIPPGSVTLMEFWKGKADPKKAAPKKTGSSGGKP